MQRQKILLVDDEEFLSDLILEGLQLEGDYKVERACNGQEAFEKYKVFLPDLDQVSVWDQESVWEFTKN